MRIGGSERRAFRGDSTRKGSQMDDIHVLAERPQVSESDVLRHFRAFKTPAHDFDPCTASERELMVHGLPRRPNRETHPRLAANWARTVAQQGFAHTVPDP